MTYQQKLLYDYACAVIRHNEKVDELTAARDKLKDAEQLLRRHTTVEFPTTVILYGNIAVMINKSSDGNGLTPFVSTVTALEKLL